MSSRVSLETVSCKGLKKKQKTQKTSNYEVEKQDDFSEG